MAMAAALEARGGLAGGREREGRGLGLVEDGVGVLTSRGIGPRWPGRGDRRCSVLQLEEEEEFGLRLLCTATSCGWCEASRCSTRLNL